MVLLCGGALLLSCPHTELQPQQSTGTGPATTQVAKWPTMAQRGGGLPGPPAWGNGGGGGAGWVCCSPAAGVSLTSELCESVLHLSLMEK